MKLNYSVKQIARLAGVSVRTLHLYDQMGLLKPAVRTRAGYRQYNQDKLLRLQQILFYRELDLPLKEIAEILNDPDFDLVQALAGHKTALLARRNRLNTLLKTIDKTIINLKNKSMNNLEELYEGMPKEQVAAWRKEAMDKWGEDTVLRSENALREIDKLDLDRLKADQKDIAHQLQLLRNHKPESEGVQEQIARHYANIRSFWGISDPTDLRTETYKGLTELYLADERYTTTEGQTDPDFAAFMRNSMLYFAEHKLK
ncbi:DNA-binding transcriptional regulator, MerR family [Mucilaginibacter sp. OK268]|uniref:MerR family transcriptional regulator n=1 Tax=Mucilaginibacter sp. OK268 TaxID=1881048 RepID=UPI0008844B51|nr:MerR family transcriptional regulator [Mucilaginibacter sp. OK268]SDQ00946.1 DNA-binding transcriptional regulator, MerR family [Mucilaginibacter sp. OK268]